MLSKLLGDFPRVIQLLRDDHKLVRSLFAQYDKATMAKSLRSLKNFYVN
jgi:hypothetical protein